MQITFEEALIRNRKVILEGDLSLLSKSRSLRIKKILNKTYFDFKTVSEAIMCEIGELNYIDFWRKVNIIKEI